MAGGGVGGDGDMEMEGKNAGDPHLHEGSREVQIYSPAGCCGEVRQRSASLSCREEEPVTRAQGPMEWS